MAAPQSRLEAPSTPLADGEIRLDPLTQSDADELLPLLDDEPITRFTRVPEGADAAFVSMWIARYEAGLEEGSRIAFAIRAHDGTLVGWAGLVEVDLERRQGEIGYLVGSAARGRGIARRAVELLTSWGFEGLGFERVELRIDTANVPSSRVAERAGYRLDGVLRNVHFKDDIRSDLAVWSRLRQD